MSRQYQDPRFQPADSSYQPSSSPPRQSEQPIQQYSTTQEGYSSHQNPHAYPATTYQESQQQPQPPAHSTGYPPYAGGHVPAFPVPYAESSSRQHSATGHPATYATASALPQSTIGTYRQDHQDSYGYRPSGGTSSSSHLTYPTSDSVATIVGSYARSEVQNTGSGYNTGMSPQLDTQNWDDAGPDEGHHSPDFRHKGPQSLPAVGQRPTVCRFPGCNNPVFLDRRVNVWREWCSDEHMRAAIQGRIEKPCRHCGQWPRRYGYKYCSGELCQNPFVR